MRKNEQFVLGSLAFVCLLLQAFFGLALGIMFMIVASTNLRHELPYVLAQSMDISQSSLSLSIIASYLLAFLVITAILTISYLNCIRTLLKNLNEEIYFEERNLKLIRKSLIYYGATVGLEILLSLVNSVNQVVLLSQGSSDNFFYLFKGTLMILGIYVIYMVFKNGIRLKRESDAII